MSISKHGGHPPMPECDHDECGQKCKRELAPSAGLDALENDMKKQEIKKLLAIIEQRTKGLAKDRDELRKAFEDLEAVLESTGRGIEDIETGMRDIERGLDACSEYI
jgi:hypothetical protein